MNATLWDDGRPIDLGSLGGEAVDSNRRGQVVGWSEDEGGGVRHAVMSIVRP